MKTEAEIAVTQLQAKDRPQPPEAGRGAWDRFSPTAFSLILLHQHLDFRRQDPQNWERIHFCCFKPSSLWWFCYSRSRRLTEPSTRSQRHLLNTDCGVMIEKLAFGGPCQAQLGDSVLVLPAL